MVHNNLHTFLLKEGVPLESLPKLITISKQNLVPMMEGYAKKNPTKKIYICVCNSGHKISCKDCSWMFSGWSIRIDGQNAIFMKGDWKFDIAQIPVSQDILFVISKRTNQNELAYGRSDMVCFSRSANKLVKKPKHNETNRKSNKNK